MFSLHKVKRESPKEQCCVLTGPGHEAGGPCRKQADVLFLIDTTSNMDYDYFRTYMLGFVTDVVQQLDVDTGRTRVAVISFSDSAQVDKILTFIIAGRSLVIATDSHPIHMGSVFYRLLTYWCHQKKFFGENWFHSLYYLKLS